MQKCVVFIPIHSNLPSHYELISFQQCFEILSSYKILIVAPKGTDLSKYQNVVKKFNLIYIDSKWQSSLLNYNKLKLSRYFYSLFPDFEYLLTYELDAFVFKDELLQWCDQGFDYIGAPWFEGYTKTSETSKMIGVGNSGFSLRKISAMKNLLTNYYYQPSIKQGRIKYFLSLLEFPFFYFGNKMGENISIQKNYNWYEDYFICQVVTQKFSLHIAPIEKAISFSFEANPSLLYELNHNKLPMGCHAWWRYDLEFWKPFINSFGYNI